jgi:hypothetical protein
MGGVIAWWITGWQAQPVVGGGADGGVALLAAGLASGSGEIVFCARCGHTDGGSVAFYASS